MIQDFPVIVLGLYPVGSNAVGLKYGAESGIRNMVLRDETFLIGVPQIAVHPAVRPD